MANALAYQGDATTSETQRFIRTFDKFFACLNVRHPEEYIQRRKPNLKPYKSTDDERFNVCFVAADILLSSILSSHSGWRKTSWATSMSGRTVSAKRKLQRQKRPKCY